MAECVLLNAIVATVLITNITLVSSFTLICLEERKQFLDKNHDYMKEGIIEEVIVDGKKIRRHTKG